LFRQRFQFGGQGRDPRVPFLQNQKRLNRWIHHLVNHLNSPPAYREAFSFIFPDHGHFSFTRRHQ
jgi:hypothetical protein